MYGTTPECDLMDGGDMSDLNDATEATIPEPDPRFKQFPVPNTVEQVVIRIVDFVGFGVEDAGGPAFRFERNGAEVAFEKNWGRHIAKQLKRFPENPWSAQWKNIVHIAKSHGAHAVRLAKAAGRRQVSVDDFVEGGKLAAEECLKLFGRGTERGARGCWC